MLGGGWGESYGGFGSVYVLVLGAVRAYGVCDDLLYYRCLCLIQFNLI
jgi:hypothetical protein